MKLNSDKCNLLVSGTKYEHSWAKIGDDKIRERLNIYKQNLIKNLNFTGILQIFASKSIKN